MNADRHLEACVQRCDARHDGGYHIRFGELHGRVLVISSKDPIPVGSFVPIIVSEGRARLAEDLCLAGRG